MGKLLPIPSPVQGSLTHDNRHFTLKIYWDNSTEYYLQPLLDRMLIDGNRPQYFAGSKTLTTVPAASNGWLWSVLTVATGGWLCSVLTAAAAATGGWLWSVLSAATGGWLCSVLSAAPAATHCWLWSVLTAATHCWLCSVLTAAAHFWLYSVDDFVLSSDVWQINISHPKFNQTRIFVLLLMFLSYLWLVCIVLSYLWLVCIVLSYRWLVCIVLHFLLNVGKNLQYKNFEHDLMSQNDMFNT